MDKGIGFTEHQLCRHLAMGNGNKVQQYYNMAIGMVTKDNSDSNRGHDNNSRLYSRHWCAGSAPVAVWSWLARPQAARWLRYWTSARGSVPRITWRSSYVLHPEQSWWKNTNKSHLKVILMKDGRWHFHRVCTVQPLMVGYLLLSRWGRDVWKSLLYWEYPSVYWMKIINSFCIIFLALILWKSDLNF